MATEIRLQRLHRAAVRKAQTWPLTQPVRLNLGCGENVKAGWLNVDLLDDIADLHLDLREPLPFPSDSIAVIYSEHVFEHLAYPCVHDTMAWSLEGPEAPSEAMQLLRESFRVLVPGGQIHIGVPDAGRAATMYVRREYEKWGPEWVDTPMHFLNYVFRQGREHKYAYDEETLGRILRAAGFANVVRREFRPDLDSEHRRTETLYMNANKPLKSEPGDPGSATGC